MWRSRRLLFLALCLVLPIIGAFALPIVLSVLAPHLIFRPLPLGAAETDPAVWGLPHAQQVSFAAADGVQLHGWWVPSLHRGSCGAVLLFHGRSANISTRAPAAQWFSGAGYDILLFDYRGYGASQDVAPSEAGLYLDSEAAYRFTTGERLVAPERLILLGQSMGAAMAAHVAAEYRAAALVLVSPYTSAPGMLRSMLPRWLPEGWPDWQRNRFDVQARVLRSRMPLVIAASRTDEQIPHALSLSLYHTAPLPKRWVEVGSLEHNGLLQHPQLHQELLSALQEVLPCSAPVT